MINFDDYAHENNGIAFKTMKELRSHNLKWSYITDHPCRILKIGGSGSGKTNALLNLINDQPDIDKIHLYAKDPCEAKQQFSSNKSESTELKCCDDPKAFTEY